MQHFQFERDICTGLGDRLGLILTLAALARVENASVAFKWCTDHSPVMSRIRPHIPLWNGYNFSLAELQNRFNLPPEITFTPPAAPLFGQAAKVQWQHVGVPAEQGLDSVYTTAWRTMRLSMHHMNGKRRAAFKGSRPQHARCLRPRSLSLLHSLCATPLGHASHCHFKQSCVGQ